MAHQCAMLFKREKHGAPVRHAFQEGKAWRTSAPCFSRGKSMAHQCAAISHTWCKKAVAESNSVTADVSVPNLRSKALTHHQVFWLMQPGAAENLPKRPARLPAFSWVFPTMAAFRRKAAQLHIQLRGKPRTLTGFLLIPPPRSAAAKGTMIRRISFAVSKDTTTLHNCQLLFAHLNSTLTIVPRNSPQSNRVRLQFSVVKPARSEYNKKNQTRKRRRARWMHKRAKFWSSTPAWAA